MRHTIKKIGAVLWRIKSDIFWIIIIIGTAIQFHRMDKDTHPIRHPQLNRAIDIAVPTIHRFDPRHGYSIKEYDNIGLTYYAVGEPTVPGTTGRSGRHVYLGSIAVSRDFIKQRRVDFGDIIWVKSTDQYYIVEDTMHQKYNNRVDIFTDKMEVAQSGSSRTSIIIIRSDKADTK